MGRRITEFPWEKLDGRFLMKAIKASDLSERLKEIAADSPGDQIQLAGIMRLVCKYPDDRFIKENRKLIEQELIFNYEDEVKAICNAHKITVRGKNEKLRALAQKPLSAGLIIDYQCAMYNICGYDYIISPENKFLRPISINMKDTVPEEVHIEDYQEEAINQLHRFYIEEDKTAGMLVMPTGSGKTRTAVYFLTREMISRGYQILWITHRHMLIEQAADSFYNFAGLAKVGNPGIRDYNLCCVSGRHLKITEVHYNDHLVASISSVCRSKVHLLNNLGRKVMIVVDEAHHTYARSYRDTIKFIRKHRKNVKLLGLTATPIRTDDRASLVLRGLYDNEIIYSVPMSDLIKKGVLSDPIPITVKTNQCFENDLTPEEINYITKKGDLPDNVIRKLAECKARNSLILKEYDDHKDIYGKTLIFALDVDHCRLMCDDFRKAGIRCDCVYSGKADNDLVISEFKNGQLDVLINVNILSEGSDVPNIQTVFLTRPTQSEGLLVQMVGRGMRGKKFGGTEKVNIVDFHDQWNVFKGWLNPDFVLHSEEVTMMSNEELKAKIDAEEELSDEELYAIEWNKVLEVYRALKLRLSKYDRMTVLPDGWITVTDEDGKPYTILIFRDQLKGIKKLREKQITEWIRKDRSVTPADVIAKCFNSFCNAPTENEIRAYIHHIRTEQDRPQLHLLKDRKKIDPYYVVRETLPENTSLESYAGTVYDSYPAAADIFGSREDYISAVMYLKEHPEEDLIGSKVEELPLEFIPYDLTPKHDLAELTQEVKDEYFGGEYEGITLVEWTDAYYKSYFGVHYPDGRVYINKILNSENVDREVIKFVIYHEFIHRDIHGHGKDFKAREHQFRNYEKCESFLMGEMPLFDIKEW